ncbi:hypothetical protein X975_17426, partial [Stegodyphus mimosarum]
LIVFFYLVLRNYGIAVLFVGQRLGKQRTGNSSNCLRILLTYSVYSQGGVFAVSSTIGEGALHNKGRPYSFCQNTALRQ